MKKSNNVKQHPLIAEQKKDKIKHNPANIVKIAKQKTGKGGERGSGLQHILDNHRLFNPRS